MFDVGGVDAAVVDGDEGVAGGGVVGLGDGAVFAGYAVGEEEEGFVRHCLGDGRFSCGVGAREAEGKRKGRVMRVIDELCEFGSNCFLMALRSICRKTEE